MQVRCPHCQGIFSTERAGIQFCPNCGQQINVPGSAAPGAPETPAGAVPPTAGPGLGGTPGQTGTPESMGPGGREPTPWERRAELGAFGGLWETWKKSMFSPEPFFSSVRPEGNWVDAMLYGWIVTAVGSLLSAPLSFLSLRLNQADLSKLENLPPQAKQIFEAMQSANGRMVLIALSALPLVFYPVILFVRAALVHLSCMIWGCAKNGYLATTRALGYTSSPSALAALTVIPCVGSVFGLAYVVYQIVLDVFALGRIHDSTFGRSTGAVLTLYVVLCCCLCGGVFFAVFSLMSAAGAAMPD